MFHASVARAYSNLQNYDHNEQELLKIWLKIKEVCMHGDFSIIYPIPEHPEGIKHELQKEGYNVHEVEHMFATPIGLKEIWCWSIQWDPIISNDHVELKLDTVHHRITAIEAGKLSGFKYHKILLGIMAEIQKAVKDGHFHIEVNHPDGFATPGYRCVHNKLNKLGYQIDVDERTIMDSNGKPDIEYYWRIKW